MVHRGLTIKKRLFQDLQPSNNRMIKRMYVKGEIKKGRDTRSRHSVTRATRRLIDRFQPPKGSSMPMYNRRTLHSSSILYATYIYCGGNITHYFSHCKRFCQKIDCSVVQGPPGSCFGSLNRRRRRQARPIRVSLR